MSVKYVEVQVISPPRPRPKWKCVSYTPTAENNIFQKKLLSALLYFSVTKSGASESRYDLTKPGTPLIDLGSQVVSIEPKEKSFHKIFHLPTPFPWMSGGWLWISVAGIRMIQSSICRAMLGFLAPWGSFIPFPFLSSSLLKSSHHCHLRIKIFATCVLSYSPLESGKQWNSFIRGEKEEKTVDRKTMEISDSTAQNMMMQNKMG